MDQLQPQRLAEVIAGVLRTRIIGGQLPDGSRLPKQDELLREFRVSRPSLREALRVLESEGLLVVQRGNVGGAVVRAPKPASAAYTLGLVLQSQHTSVADLAVAIRNVEPAAAALCAQRPDRLDVVLPQLTVAHGEAQRALGRGIGFTDASRRFHEIFVSMCGNDTLIVVLGALEKMWSQQERQWARQKQTSASYPSIAAQRAVVEAHGAVLAAIEAGDGERAARLARAHLAEAQRYTLVERGEMTVVCDPVRRAGDPNRRAAPRR